MTVDPVRFACRDPLGRVLPQRRAYTLAEMLSAMAIMTIIIGASSSALTVASRALDTSAGSNGAAGKTMLARDVIDTITADLRMAMSFSEQTADAVTFTVADRDDDALPETIRYAWSSETGLLTRDTNSNGPVTIATGVESFDLTYLNRTVSPPPQPCCDGSANCEMLPPDLCADGGGTPKGKNLTCDDNPCGGACCLTDGSCTETTELACQTVEVGTYQGNGTFCADIECPVPLKVLLVLDDPADLTLVDSDRIALFESWSFEVIPYESDLSQAEFDAAVADADIAYILPSADHNAIADKFNSSSKGIVNEYREMSHRLLVWQSRWDEVTHTAILVDDNSHYITSPFNTGLLTLLNESNKLLKSKDDPAAGATLLASPASDASRTALAVVDTGHLLYDGSRAAGRRVLLPWGTEIMASSFNEDGLYLMRRAMEWASGQGPSQPRLLFVVTDAGSPTAQETARQTLFESWGYEVQLITANSSQASYDAAVATTVVAYLSEDINSSDVGTKLTDASLGVVSEEVQLCDELGLAGGQLFKARDSINIIDNAHYITSGISLGPLVIFDSIQPVHMLSDSYAPGLSTLGETLNVGSIYKPSLAVLETGAALEGGGTAAGRRVELPWGGNELDINALTADGQEIMRRAIEWAAGVGS